LSRDVLVLTSQIPWPLNSGGHIRTYHLLRALASRYHVRLLTTTSDSSDEGIRRLAELGIEVCAAHVPRGRASREAMRVLYAAACHEPYVLYRRHDRRTVRSLIQDYLRASTPDVVYLDHLDSLVYQPLFPDIPCVVDLHNVYSKLAERVAGEQSNWLMRRYLLRESRLLAQMEKRAAGTVDALFAVSREEQEYFEVLGADSVHLVPNGVDCAAYSSLPLGRCETPPVILFLGALSWEPNVKAAAFLARYVLPEVRSQVPDARLQIVGRDPVSALRELASLPGVSLAADVPDVGPYLRDARVLAVPLDSGGGTRLKILEAFAAGLPVVSSPIGCEGIDAIDGVHLRIISNDRFAETLTDVLRNPQSATDIAQHARALVRERYDWSSIGQLACDAIERIVGKRNEESEARLGHPISQVEWAMR
jgi:glycosyltransferase involved in cell wall biosynthesis